MHEDSHNRMTDQNDHITHDEEWWATTSEEIEDSDGNDTGEDSEEDAWVHARLRTRTYLANIAAGRYPRRNVEPLCVIAARAAVAHGSSMDPFWFLRMDPEDLPEQVNEWIRKAIVNFPG